MQTNGGENLYIEDDKEILNIDSPRGNVSGPWFVVHKDNIERWAIVVLHFGEKAKNNMKPTLGIRWFKGTTGTPSVRGYATWFIVPDMLIRSILDSLPLEKSFRQKVNEILSGKYTIPELEQERKIKYGF